MPFITALDQKIYYQLSVPDKSNGITFFFIHGLGSSHAFYSAIVPALVEKGFACLAVDTPGTSE
jgi:pimeloyl-ACP methyl ester carboxylesterase